MWFALLTCKAGLPLGRFERKADPRVADLQYVRDWVQPELGKWLYRYTICGNVFPEPGELLHMLDVARRCIVVVRWAIAEPPITSSEFPVRFSLGTSVLGQNTRKPSNSLQILKKRFQYLIAG